MLAAQCFVVSNPFYLFYSPVYRGLLVQHKSCLLKHYVSCPHKLPARWKEVDPRFPSLEDIVQVFRSNPHLLSQCSNELPARLKYQREYDKVGPNAMPSKDPTGGGSDSLKNQLAELIGMKKQSELAKSQSASANCPPAYAVTPTGVAVGPVGAGGPVVSSLVPICVHRGEDPNDGKCTVVMTNEEAGSTKLHPGLLERLEEDEDAKDLVAGWESKNVEFILGTSGGDFTYKKGNASRVSIAEILQMHYPNGHITIGIVMK